MSSCSTQTSTILVEFERSPLEFHDPHSASNAQGIQFGRIRICSMAINEMIDNLMCKEWNKKIFDTKKRKQYT